MLTQLDAIPDQLLEVGPKELFTVLSGPTLIHLQGRRKEPLFVSTLLHGNEDTGFIALQKLLREHAEKELPRSLSVFFGNIQAARFGRRRLDDQPDYNRIWLGPGDTPEHQMMRQIVKEMRARQVFASVDIHNNTGVNPHYACVNRLDQRFYHLATLFSRVVVYFIRPHGVQSMAFAELCPSVTVECGHVGEKTGIQHAKEFLNACLNLAEIPDQPVPPHDLDLYHTVATVKVPEGITFGFGKEEAEIVFQKNVDHMNFTELSPGTLLGRLGGSQKARLKVISESGHDVDDKFLDYSGGEVRTKLFLMPSMFTLNREVISQDCLGYFMERIALGL
jgi:succinylglutamate desuccinylase